MRAFKRNTAMMLRYGFCLSSLVFSAFVTAGPIDSIVETQPVGTDGLDSFTFHEEVYRNSFTPGSSDPFGIFGSQSPAPSLTFHQVTGSSGADFDRNAKYLYLFQVLGSGTGRYKADNISMPVFMSSITSSGFYLDKSSFNHDTPVVISACDASSQPGGATGFICPAVLDIGFLNNVMTTSFDGLQAADDASWIYGFTSNLSPFPRDVKPGNVSATIGGTIGADSFSVAFDHIGVPIPEPSTLALLGLGLAGLAVRKRAASR